MQLIFDSIEEVQEFVKKLKGTRGGSKAGEADEAPATQTGQLNPPPLPMQPPGGAQFNPNAAALGAQGGPFGGGQAAPMVPPEVINAVNLICGTIDAAIKAGQPEAKAVEWFRIAIGPDAASADLNAIKTRFLPQMPYARLQEIGKQMNLAL